MTIERLEAREAVLEFLRLKDAQGRDREAPHGNRPNERVLAGNEAHALRSQPGWGWYLGELEKCLAQAEADLSRWVDEDSRVSQASMDGAALAYHKTMRAVARERVNILKWAAGLVENAISRMENE